MCQLEYIYLKTPTMLKTQSDIFTENKKEQCSRSEFLKWHIVSQKPQGGVGYRCQAKTWRANHTCIVRTLKYPDPQLPSVKQLSFSNGTLGLPSRISVNRILWDRKFDPALGRLKQEGHEFDTSLGYPVRPRLKKKKEKPQHQWQQKTNPTMKMEAALTIWYKVWKVFFSF